MTSTQTAQATPLDSLRSLPYEEVLSAAIEYFNGDELAANVWINKYALKDSFGNIYDRTPDDMHHRIARELARIENKYPQPLSEETLYEALRNFKYIIPQGGPMAGIGTPFQVVSLSNCFVIGHDHRADSYGGVMKMDEEQVQLMKRRGGVGHDLSYIRPKGSPVMNSALSSTGVVPFMERHSNSTREVAQDGRRGALMLSISVKHPDAEHFIDAKMDGTKVTGANVSVKITDEFMQAMKSGQPFVQQYPIDDPQPTYTKEVDAVALWKKIIHNAWASAEPGLLFWDTVIRESIPDCYADLGFRTVSTNPCGEIPLCPYDSCRLLAINLYAFVDHPFTPEASFDMDRFREYVRLGQRIMDDIVDLEIENVNKIIQKIKDDPEGEEVKRTERMLWEKILIKCEQGRRTGVGSTGEGDMLAALGLRYGSEAALEFSVNVHKNLALAAYGASVEMARDRGAFPIYDSVKEANNPFVLRLKEADPALYADMVQYGRRNIALLTIAPTGTTSLMTQTTSGIEPVFMVSYKRRRKVNPNDKNVKVDFVDEVGDSWEEYHVFHHKFVTWLQINGYDPAEVSTYDQEALQAIIEQTPYHKATSNDVDWVAKVRMQGAVQKWVDHSISVTVNVPNDISEEMVAKIYETGWESGCKGMTIYRDGSRSGVLISDEKKEKKKEAEFNETHAPKRPEKLEAEVVRFMNKDQKWVAVVGLYKGRPYEIFTGRAEDSFSILQFVDKGYVVKQKDESGESRYDFQYLDKDGYKVSIEGLSRTFDPVFWNYAKLISGVLRHGMPLPHVVQLISDFHLSEEYLNTWKTGVARALKRFIPDGTQVADNTCTACGEKSLVYQEGCVTCQSCGYSKCG